MIAEEALPTLSAIFTFTEALTALTVHVEGCLLFATHEECARCVALTRELEIACDRIQSQWPDDTDLRRCMRYRFSQILAERRKALTS